MLPVLSYVIQDNFVEEDPVVYEYFYDETDTSYDNIDGVITDYILYYFDDETLEYRLISTFLLSGDYNEYTDISIENSGAETMRFITEYDSNFWHISDSFLGNQLLFYDDYTLDVDYSTLNFMLIKKAEDTEYVNNIIYELPLGDNDEWVIDEFVYVTFENVENSQKGNIIINKDENGLTSLQLLIDYVFDNVFTGLTSSDINDTYFAMGESLLWGDYGNSFYDWNYTITSTFPHIHFDDVRVVYISIGAI